MGRCSSRASRAQPVGAQSEAQVRRALSGLETEGWRLRHSLPGRGRARLLHQRRRRERSHMAIYRARARCWGLIAPGLGSRRRTRCRSGRSQRCRCPRQTPTPHVRASSRTLRPEYSSYHSSGSGRRCGSGRHNRTTRVPLPPSRPGQAADTCTRWQRPEDMRRLAPGNSPAWGIANLIFSSALLRPSESRRAPGTFFCVSSGPGARSASTRMAARPREREPGALAGRHGSGRQQAHQRLPQSRQGGIYLSQVGSRHGLSTGGRARERIGSFGRGRPGRGLTIRLR